MRFGVAGLERYYGKLIANAIVVITNIIFVIK